jgi:2-polyprenyl-3-methyl-5-hydroxy-6-metoxy-1,4-benzoquinol methylase
MDCFGVQKNMSENEFRVGEKDKDRAFSYYDQGAMHYNENVARGLLVHFRNRERNAILRFARLSESSGQKVIDVGCGGGFYSREAKRYQHHVSAVDFSPGMVDSVKSYVDAAWVADVETLSCKEKYDIVICSGVLDFVLNPEKAFANLVQLVSPKGRLVLQVPRSGLLGWIYRLEKKFAKMNVNLYSLDWFSVHAQKYGFQLVSYHYPLPYNMVLLFEKDHSSRSR